DRRVSRWSRGVHRPGVVWRSGDPGAAPVLRDYAGCTPLRAGILGRSWEDLGAELDRDADADERTDLDRHRAPARFRFQHRDMEDSHQAAHAPTDRFHYVGRV